MAEPSIAERSDDSDPVAVFRVWLQKFRAECGDPSIRDLERLFGRIGRPQSQSVIQAKLTGRTTPNWAFVETFVEVCVRHAGNGLDPELPVSGAGIPGCWRRWPSSAGQRRRWGRCARTGGWRRSPPRRRCGSTAGRARWIRCWPRWDTHRSAVLLLGPSGAGKSSLVRAGVLPALAAGRLPGSDRWLQVYARPGQDLAAELDRAGLPGAGAS